MTTGEPSLPILNSLLNAWIVAWPWRFLKTNVKDYKMSELFKNGSYHLSGEGKVLVTGSIVGFIPGPFNAIYNATKAFIDNFTEALRNELKDSEGGTLTIRIDKGDNQPALRVDLRKGTVETTRFVSFVSAEIGGVKFTANDGVSFGTDTINQQFRIELQNFTTKPEESSGAAASSIYENLTQVFTPQSDRGVFVAQVYGDQVTDEVFKLAQKKSVSLGPFSGSSQNRGGNWYQPTSRTLVV